MPVTVRSDDVAAVQARVTRLLHGTSRVIIGVTGPPGAGKSTFVAALAGHLDQPAVVVPFDGFHLSNEVLAELGRADRKGAIDTFDLSGYRALIDRLASDRDDDVVYAPLFSRRIEQSIGSALPIIREARVILTEGNYLLADHPDLRRARARMAEVWYIDVPDDVRVERLIGRHMAAGKDAESARRWTLGSDEVNAELVRSTRPQADVLVELATVAVG